MKHSKQLFWRILLCTLCLLMTTPALMIVPSAETSITNLYDKSTAYAGYISGSNAEKPSTSHYTSTPIAVTEGDVITFGPCKTQDFYLHGYNDSGAIADSTVGIAKLTKGESFGSYYMLSYTVPAGVTSVRVVNAAAINDIFVITKNNVFGVSQFNAYWKATNPTMLTTYGTWFEKKDTSVLYQKSALFVGDSISCGSQEGSLYYRAWAGRIGVVNSMDYVNASVSGASCSTTRETNRIVSQLLANRDKEFDYVIMHGGVNDAWDTAPVGEMVDGYDLTDFDTTTFAGGLEHMFYYANYLYPHSKMGYIMNFKAPKCTKGTVADMDEYFAVAKKICKKWNIPVLNLYEDEDFCNNILKTDTTENLPDNIHPNTHGYDLLYPVIEAWMETLPGNTFTLNAQENIIKLATEADLENLRTYPEATFQLTNDIVVTKAWTPISTFSGVLDGQGYTISGINITDAATTNWSNSGFIAHANGCTVKNLTVAGSINNTAATVSVQIGGFAGQASNANFINCTSKMNITTGTASGPVYVGGIVGVAAKNTTTTLTNCVNKGTLDIKCATGWINAGGLVGQASGAMGITGGGNYGAVTVTPTTAGNGIGAGIMGTDAGGTTLTRVVNHGTITVNSRYLSGIIGNNAKNIITNASYCANVGMLKGIYAPTNGQFYGQILGRGQGSNGTFSYCVGLGKYELTTSSGNYIGGISGSEGKNRFLNCFTTYSKVLGYGLSASDVTGSAIITAETDLAAVVATLNTGLSVGNEAFVLDDGQIEPVYELNRVATQIYATQEATAEEDSTVDVRILALVNSLSYDKAGVRLYKVGDDTPIITKTTTTVYSGVVDGQDVLYAPYGTYYLPITVKGIRNSGTYNFVVETFVQNEGESVQTGEAYTITVTDGTVVSAMKKEQEKT